MPNRMILTPAFKKKIEQEAIKNYESQKLEKFNKIMDQVNKEVETIEEIPTYKEMEELIHKVDNRVYDILLHAKNEEMKMEADMIMVYLKTIRRRLMKIL